MKAGDKAIILVVMFYLIGVVTGYYAGKHSADRWWQADEAKRVTYGNWLSQRFVPLMDDSDMRFRWTRKGRKI